MGALGAVAILHIANNTDETRSAFSHSDGPPDQVLPALARWISHCRTAEIVPSADNYCDFTSNDDDGNHFLDSYPFYATEPTNNQFVYVAVVEVDGDRWHVDLCGRNRDEIVLDPGPCPVWHHTRVTSTSTRPVEDLVMSGLRGLVQFARSANRPGRGA